jgi:tRNA (guanine6-N2)-methyltransferase
MPPLREFDLMARTVRGLEWVVAAEIKGRLEASIISVSHREVHFRLPGIDRRLMELRTADDVFLTCGTIEAIDHTRASLQRLEEEVRKLDLTSTVSDLERVRSVGNTNCFDIVGSFLGKRNYNRYEIEEAVGRTIASIFSAAQLPSSQRAGAEISWRVHLRHTDAYVGLRLLPTPLHRRSYRSNSYKGSLHPPVAAAMALLSGLGPNTVFLDPCCGSGTIGIEASFLEDQLLALACDINPLAISQARCSATQADTQLDLRIADAGHLPFGYRVIDRIACNMPWGRTVQPSGSLRVDSQPFWREIRRVCYSESRIVVLSENHELDSGWWETLGFCLVLQCRICIRGRWSTLSVLTMDSHSNPSPIDEWGLWGTELLGEWETRAHEDFSSISA